MTNEISEQEIVVPETFYKVKGVKDTYRSWEDQAWEDFCTLLANEEYPYDIYYYSLVHVLWDLNSTTKYGTNIYNDGIIDTGQIYGKQATGILIVAGEEVILQARGHISQEHPAYPRIFSKGGLVSLMLSGLAQKKAIDLTIYPQDFVLHIPLDGLHIGMQSHDSLRNAIAIQHPEVGSLRIENIFTGDDTEIIKIIRAVQKKLRHQEQKKLLKDMMNSLSSEEMNKEIAAIASLRELNPEAYEAAIQAIVKKYGGI